MQAELLHLNMHMVISRCWKTTLQLATMLLMALVWMQNMNYYKRHAELITTFTFTEKTTMDGEFHVRCIYVVMLKLVNYQSQFKLYTFIYCFIVTDHHDIANDGKACTQLCVFIEIVMSLLYVARPSSSG